MIHNSDYLIFIETDQIKALEELRLILKSHRGRNKKNIFTGYFNVFLDLALKSLESFLKYKIVLLSRPTKITNAI